MKLRATLAPLLLASIVALGVVAAPSVAADAATVSKVTTGTVSVKVVNVKGKVIKSPRPEMILSGTNGNGVNTNSKGVATFKKVSAGKHTVDSNSGQYVAVSKSVKVSAGKTTKVTVKLIVGGKISGTLRDGNGDPVPFVPVSVLSSTGKALATAYTSKSGAYVLSGLKKASYRVGFNASIRAADVNPDYTTTYWKSATGFKSAKAIAVKAQTTKASATSTKKVNGVIKTLPTGIVSGILNVENADEVMFTNVVTGTSSTFVADTGNAFTAELLVGSYRVTTDVYTAVVGGSGTWERFFYTGDGLAVSAKSADALLVDVTADSTRQLTIGDYVAP